MQVKDTRLFATELPGLDEPVTLHTVHLTRTDEYRPLGLKVAHWQNRGLSVMSIGDGGLVSKYNEGQVSERFRIEEGDIILAVNGTEGSSQTLVSAMAVLSDSVTLRIRKGPLLSV
uniref:PDZ domain-containing protein n=1 Tax=Alexandrium monilatum TaxID=311494 RepID=A0A7S4PTV4_9DINO